MKYYCRPDGTYVALGSVDVDDDNVSMIRDVRPAQHIFLKERAGWWDGVGEDGDEDGWERWEGFDAGFQRRLVEWEDAVRERTGF